MSEFIKILNKIKKNYCKDWLTLNQKNVFASCKKLIKSYFIINIYGAMGFGKTFLGWVLAKEVRGKYFPSLEKYNETNNVSKKIIIDNCESDRNFARKLRSIGLRKNLDEIIFITTVQLINIFGSI
ncbi:hypothetical protein ES703_122942 [subsurface metagenome]